MANTIDKILRLAENEVGYLEKSKAAYAKDPDVIYQKTEGAGYDNITKYGKEMHELYPQVMDFPAPWCDSYFDYLCYVAYGVSTAKSVLHGNFDDYTVASAMMYYKHGALDRTPKPGDQIFFSRNGSIQGIFHTGLVRTVDQFSIGTNEGNTSAGTKVNPNGGGVFNKVYSRDSMAMKRAWFGHPKYDIVDAAEKAASAAKTQQEKAEHVQLKLKVTKYEPDKHITGDYRVIASDGLNIRSGASTAYQSMGVIPRGQIVSCYGYFDLYGGKRWYLVYYPKWQIIGYCSSQYLAKK